jgi:hypothetical protein
LGSIETCIRAGSDFFLLRAEMDKFYRRILDIVETIKLRHLIIGAVLSLLSFACLFMFGGSHGWGLKEGAGPVLDFGSCLYFSVVTFTSLGFGDLRPVGYGRMLAGLEVVVGLTFFGLAVAKLSSYKQSYLLNQLYARDIQGKLDQFAMNLRAHRFSCKELSGVLKTKGAPGHRTSELIWEVRSEVHRIRAFVSFESRNGYLLSATPIGSMTRLLKSLSSLVPRVVELSCVRRTRASQKHRESAKEVIRLIERIGGDFSKTKNESVRSEFNGLKKRCDGALIELDTVSGKVGVQLEEHEMERRRAYGLQSSQAEPPLE